MPHNYNLRSTPAAPATNESDSDGEMQAPPLFHPTDPIPFVFYSSTEYSRIIFNRKDPFHPRALPNFMANIETQKIFDSLTEPAQEQWRQRTRGPRDRMRDATNADVHRAAYQEILEQLQEMAEDRLLPEGAYLALSKTLMAAHNFIQPTLNLTLHIAAHAGDAQCMTACLDAGADVNAQDAYGDTVLMAASFRGHLDIVNQLLAEGVSVNTARTENGTTALMIAVRTNHPAIVRALIESGRADINARDAEGNTALMAASAHGHLAIVKQLLAAGAIVNAQNHDGDTALCFATDNNFLPGPARAIHLPAQHGWLCVNQLAAVAAVLREAGVNQLVAAAAALRDALPDTPPHY